MFREVRKVLLNHLGIARDDELIDASEQCQQDHQAENDECTRDYTYLL
jgi:hypothetical protein